MTDQDLERIANLNGFNIRAYQALDPQTYFKGVRAALNGVDRDNDELRAMLAFAYGGHHLYRDDGELQDNRALPFIDFKRDSVQTIRSKMVERVQKALAVALGAR